MSFGQKMKKFFGKVGRVFENLVFPTDMKCLFCENDVPDFEHKPYCDECEKVIEFNNKNRCLICSEPIDNEAMVCDFCQKNKRNFKKAICPFVYSGKVRNSILGYKDSNKRYLAKTYARFIAEDLKREEVVVTRLTYVPLSDKKKRKRGFDQAELLAKELAKLIDVEAEKMFVRVVDGKTQKFSSFKERYENIKGVYKLTDVKLDKNDTVLIVDDVITTGATMNYCAGLLVKKVNAVYAAAIARNKFRAESSL